MRFEPALLRFGRWAAILVVLLLVLIGALVAFGLPVGESLRLLGEGAAADKFGVARTLMKSTPLLLTGLGVAIAWRAGMYNIGGEGQYVVGGLLGAACASFLAAAPAAPLGTAGILMACIAGGAIWAWLPAWLYVRRGVDVVISTILLNFVAIQLLGYAVSGPLRGAHEQVPLTEALPQAIMLHHFDPQTDLHMGAILALVTALLAWVLLFRTKLGYEIRISGASPGVARAYRIDGNRARVLAMLLSGALCGLAGGVEYVGSAGQLGIGFSQQWGFLGIPVALLGALNPIGCVPSALFFGALFAGSENLGRFTSAGDTLVYVIEALVVVGVVALQIAAQRRTATS